MKVRVLLELTAPSFSVPSEGRGEQKHFKQEGVSVDGQNTRSGSVFPFPHVSSGRPWRGKREGKSPSLKTTAEVRISPGESDLRRSQSVKIAFLAVLSTFGGGRGKKKSKSVREFL